MTAENRQREEIGPLELEALRSKASELEAELREVKRQLHRGEALLTPPRPSDNSLSPKRSIRDLVIDALGDIGFLAYSQQLAIYIRMKFGREVAANRFGSLSAEERKAYEFPTRRSARPVWLGHGITHDRAEPVKRLWGRSDWPLESRIVTPFTARVQYLRFTMHLIDLVQANAPVSELDMLKFAAVDHVRGIGIKVSNGDFSGFQDWRLFAETQLREIERRDQHIRAEAASRFTCQRSDVELLFGAPLGWDPLIVSANDDPSSTGSA